VGPFDRLKRLGRYQHLDHRLGGVDVAGMSSMSSQTSRLRSPAFFSAFALPSRASAAFASGPNLRSRIAARRRDDYCT
jgi:hypothetical protein